MEFVREQHPKAAACGRRAACRRGRGQADGQAAGHAAGVGEGEGDMRHRAGRNERLPGGRGRTGGRWAAAARLQRAARAACGGAPPILAGSSASPAAITGSGFAAGFLGGILNVRCGS